MSSLIELRRASSRLDRALVRLDSSLKQSSASRLKEVSLHLELRRIEDWLAEVETALSAVISPEESGTVDPPPKEGSDRA
ncbi:hypothetical protein PB2503_02747 [Parvularcula bermudensis HTCC2503]|uniref:Uncharacterized protein n=1 Tax=Parvularcula bermudensis (strain ATCC BAA-594 / HTCC2503 / KCTC 12087) TaxID=314260 RepID=E0TCN7_PARBH|nr:hypothetical protein [Parvularcula bermudensis]ADM08626.1 hypothetical protein PB2503_02747 [Parvularcula bermudensis HTCC2503]